ncbi:MAG: hypothetical protein ACW98D_18940 [Promethearchaeota archaeon]
MSEPSFFNKGIYPKYPIYKVSFGWVEETTENKKLTPYEKKLGLKKVEIDNGCVYEIIKKQEMTTEEIKDFMSERISSYSKENNYVIRFIETSIKLNRYESWVCDSFCHKTFKIEGKDDKWYLDSFSDYVERKEVENEKALIKQYNEGCKCFIPIPKYQLMGAEDRWRWQCKNCLDSEYFYINH